MSRTTRELVGLLLDELNRVAYPFPAPASAEAEIRRADLVRRVETEVIPALDALGQASVVGVVGFTGVGKSTLANTIAGAALSEVSPLRPTTRVPQLLVHPDTLMLLGDHPACKAAQYRGGPGLNRGWAVLDCADPFAPGNAPQLAQPDLPAGAWLVVTSALRYGDSLLWDLLQAVGQGREPVALVVNRLPEGTWETIREDLRKRLDTLDLEKVELFGLPEGEIEPQMLSTALMQPVEEWLRTHCPDPPGPLPEDFNLPELLESLTEQISLISKDQVLHTRAVALLREVTVVRAQTLAAQAEQDVPPLDPGLEEVWGALTAPGGALAELERALEPNPYRWSAGLAALKQAVAGATERDFSVLAANVWDDLVAVWQGGGVPTGSRELLEQKGLEHRITPEAGEPDHLLRIWSEALDVLLREDPAPLVRAASERFTGPGFLILVQAAALGMPGPDQLLQRLLTDQFERVLDLARKTLCQARGGAVRAALAPFEEAITQSDRAASSVLPWLQQQLKPAEVIEP